MKRENIEKVQDAMSAIGNAFYLAYNKDNNSHLNGLYEKRVSEAFEKLQPLRGHVFDIRDFVDYSLRNEIAENLLTYPNDRAFVMKETVWALFAPLARNTFQGQKTIDIVIFSYGEKVLECSLLDVWDSNFNVSESEPMAYLSSVNNMALLIIEALQDVVEIGSFDAYKDGEHLSENDNEARAKPEKSRQLPGSSKTNGQGDERHDPATLNEQIFEVLPAIYDILISDSVIPSTIKKADFISNVSKGDLSGMVGKTAKFKEFVKQIKTYFNSYWYDTACKSLDFTEKQMSSYNTNNTAMLEKDLKDILKRI